jgi:AcrR family transcriptional regulator
VGRSGRRPGGPDTRSEILAAARQRFARDGYDAATIRAIAADADIDPALVHHYFGTKPDLFRAAAAFPVDPSQLLAAMAEGTDTDRAETLARFFFRVWEDDGSRLQLLSVLRSAMTHEDAGALMRAFIGREVLGPVAEVLGIHDPGIRVPLAASQLVGIAMLRYVIRIEPLASLPTDDLDRRTELADALDSTDRQPPSAQQIANTRLQVLAAIKGTDRAVGDGGADRIDRRRRTEIGQPPGPQRPPTPSGPGHARRARPRRNR